MRLHPVKLEHVGHKDGWIIDRVSAAHTSQAGVKDKACPAMAAGI